jgi:hypothetical protein
MTFLPSASASTIVPRALRMNLLDRLIMPWRLPAAAANTLPVPVTLNRFFAADFVFILGILLLHFSCIETGRRGLFSSIKNGHGMPCRTVRTAAYNRCANKVQRDSHSRTQKTLLSVKPGVVAPGVRLFVELQAVPANRPNHRHQGSRCRHRPP